MSPAVGFPPRKHYDELLPAYINGTLTLTERCQVQAHVLHCAACRARLDAWAAVSAASKAALSPKPGTDGDPRQMVKWVLGRAAHPALESEHAPDPAQDTAPVRRLLALP